MRLPFAPAPSAILAFSACLALPAGVRAQAPSPALASVRGIVVDSLLGAPLAGARVWVDDGARWTLTDSLGRFALDSVPVRADGPTVAMVLAEHAAADSVGVGTLVARATLHAGGAAEVAIAIPSYATLRAAACRGIADAGDADGGIVFGTVRRAGTRAAAPGAAVDVAWTTLGAADGAAVPVAALAGLTATAGDDGAYYACGVPTASRVLVAARSGDGEASGGEGAGAGGARSDEVALVVGPRRIVRRDLTIAADDEVATIVVTLAGADGRPVEGGRAYVGDDAPVPIADGATRATLPGVRAGTRVVGGRAIGFDPGEVVVDAAPGDTVRVAVTLDVVPQRLATVRIDGLLAAVEARRAAHWGYFSVGDELAAKPVVGFAMPMVAPRVRTTIKGATDIGVQVFGRAGAWCTPKVMIDGRRSSLGEISTYRPDQLLAMELYPDSERAPPGFLRPDEYGCGLMLVWTRKGAGR